MKVSEKREFVGEFYLPRDPARKVHGTLKIGLDGEVSLEIVGNFEKFPYDVIQQTKSDLSLINGQVTEVGRVTLVESYYKLQISTLAGPQKKNIIGALYALCNLDVEYENMKEIKFKSLRFSVEHLNQWLHFIGAKLLEGNLAERATIKYVCPENITIKLRNGVEIQFAFDSNADRLLPDADGVKIYQSAYIKFSSEQPQSLYDFIELVDKINVFLCMALDEVVCIKDVVAYKDGHHPAVQIYYQPLVRSEESRKWHLSNALCQFQDIQENLTVIFNEWIENYERTRPTYSLYLFCKMGRVKSLEIMFLSLIQALENLHEAGRELYGWSKNNVLERKLKKLVFAFKDLIPRDQVTMWNEIIKDAVGVRNYLTHYSKTASKFKEKAENPEIVYSLYKKLEVIIQLHFLKQIGFDNREIENRLKTKAFGLESEFRGPCHGEIKEAK